jgi:asparagine synthetase B (glutamine-hydrolysing)
MRLGRISLTGVVRDGGALTPADLAFARDAAGALAASPARPKVTVLQSDFLAVAIAPADSRDASAQVAESRWEQSLAAGVTTAVTDPAAPSSHLSQLFTERDLDGLEVIRGDLAGVIWDPGRRRLLLLRDALGRRPLFYAMPPGEGVLLFSSQVAALLQYPGLRREPKVEAFAEARVFGFPVTPDLTPFSGVSQIVPGNVMEFSGGRLSTRASLPFPQAAGTGVSAEQSLARLLLAAVTDAIGGGGRPAVLLSGGLDSSLLAASVATSAASGTAYTLIDRTAAASNRDDVNTARRVAESLNWEHVLVPFDSDTWIDLLPDLILSHEAFWPASVFDPGGDAGFFAVGRAAAGAQPPHSCVLAGEAADELFGGYWMFRFPLGFVERLRLRADTVGPLVRRQVSDRFPLPEDRLSCRREVYNLLAGPGLFNYHCWCVDRTARWWGMPLATPYLDDAVVAAAMAIPLDGHIHGNTGKLILRSMAQALLPPAVADVVASRPKMALPSAAAGSLRGLGAVLERLFPSDYCGRHPYRSLLATPLDVLSFDLWYALFVTFAGEKPDGLSVHNLYQDWSHALPREGPDA